jgi:hypothetical protein
LVTDEPSTANAGDTVFYTGNVYAAESFDGGKTFAYFSKPFFPTLPQYGGLCCDQNVIYDPTHDLLIWLIQYSQDPTGHNAQRVAVIKSTALRTGLWTVFDLRPDNYGYPKDSFYWFDYPQLTLTSNNLNVLSNVFKGVDKQNNSTVIGSIVIRLPLDSLASGTKNGEGYYGEEYATRKVLTFGAAAGSQGTLYFAGNEYPLEANINLDTSIVYVYAWPEGSLTVTPYSVPHSQYTFARKGLQNCAAPDGGNWCGIEDSRVVAGWLSRGVIGFMWNAGADTTHPYPYVYSVRIDAATMTLISAPPLANLENAYAYPSVAVNARGDLGMTVQYGGRNLAPSSVVGIADDLTAAGSGWDLMFTRTGGAGPADDRWGDYLTVRPASGNGNTWVATGFTLQGGRTDAFVEPHFMWFGRERDNPIGSAPPSSTATASGSDQYHLSGSDGTNWIPIDPKLSLTLAPQVDSRAVISANADLWTAKRGINQDLGIVVVGGSYRTGTVVAWKESGGFAGTYSPNAAFVQTVISLPASGAPYTIILEWKSNHPTDGTIFAGAGNGPPYSPTRLTAELLPLSDTTVQSAAITTQEVLQRSNGVTWQDLGKGNVILQFTAPVNGNALLSGNADLWTQDPEINQDLGIRISGGSFQSEGVIVGWKESGGFAGTYSPNAAFAQTVVAMAAGTSYTIRLQWKTNRVTNGTIRSGAGNGPEYSPTRLTLRFYPGGTGLQDASSELQFWRCCSTGSDWTPLYGAGVSLTVTPAADAQYRLSANADLWTATPGVNQDMGLVISGGEFGAGQLIGWKESGGFAGTFSPNAAFLETVVTLKSGITYTITFEWKANHPTNGTIVTGAGPSSPYSPTRVTAQLLP